MFVYGIFKGADKRYSYLFQDCKFLGPATAPGFVLLDHVGPAAMVPGEIFSSVGADNTIAKGEVIEVPDARVDEVLGSLDRIESNGRAYIRAKINVHLDAGRQIEAYAYLWIEHYSAEEVIADGSWFHPGFGGRI